MQQQQQQTIQTMHEKPYIFTDYSTKLISNRQSLVSHTHMVQKMGDCFFSSWKVEPFHVPKAKKQDKSSENVRKMLPPASPNAISKQKKTIQQSTPKKLCLAFVLNSNSTTANTSQTSIRDCFNEFQVALRLNQSSLCQ